MTRWQSRAAQWLGVRLRSVPAAAMGCRGLALCLVCTSCRFLWEAVPWRRGDCHQGAWGPLLECPLVGPGMW